MGRTETALDEFKKQKAFMRDMLKREDTKQFYRNMIDAAQEVRVVPLCEVFTEDELEQVKNYVAPKQHECYKNAFYLTELFPERVQYCECEVFCPIPIGHAINKVGEQYVDITFDMVLKDVESLRSSKYIVYGEYNIKAIRDAALAQGIYGDVFVYQYAKEYETPKENRT